MKGYGLIFIFVGVTISIAGCSSMSEQSGDRSIASVSDACSKISRKISDVATLAQLGCSKDGNLSNVFTGSAKWIQNNGDLPFTEVQSLGVIMDAVQKAHRECSKKRTLCVIKTVTLDGVNSKNGRREIVYRVVIHGVDSYLTNSDLKKFDGESTINVRGELDQLSLWAAQYGAMARALNDCYSKGYALCAIAGYNLTESNSYRNGDYYTSAKATVIGVNFARPRPMSTQPEEIFKLMYGVPVPTYDLQKTSNGIEI